jgi:hypothetical protein
LTLITNFQIANLSLLDFLVTLLLRDYRLVVALHCWLEVSAVSTSEIANQQTTPELKEKYG